MNTGEIVRLYQAQAEATASRTGRIDYARAARVLDALATRLERAALVERVRKAKRRGLPVSEADQAALKALSRGAKRDGTSSSRA